MLPDQIGHYRLEKKIDAGGMGVVYKATDTRLNRPVAIKAISGKDLAKGEAAWNEALAAASLDHPYICKVYELVEEGDQTLIVMEFVEGQTLAALLKTGRPTLAETLRIATEIAEGLGNAHEHGLVHRDVKPSNIMVTPHGHIKLLDFGLARADALSSPSDQTRLAALATHPHAGTPNYMAPEQVQGQPLSARADVFSLGVILFECVTGTLPFEGATAYAYLAAVLSERPKAIDRLAPTVPADLAKVINQCLEKDPSKRPGSATALASDLRRLADDASASRVLVSIAAQQRSARLKRWTLVGAGALALALATPYLVQRYRSVPTGRVGQSQPFITWPTKELGSRISPDNQWISFLSDRDGRAQIYVQALDGGEARPVTIADGEVLSHVWSPDGRELACIVRTADKTLLQVVPAFFGGTPRLAISLGASRLIRGLRWIGDTVYLHYPAQHALRRVTLSQSTVEDVNGAWKVAGILGGFDVRPDGARVVFDLTKDGEQALWTANLDGSDVRRITHGQFLARSPVWSGSGATVIYQSNRGGQIDLWETDAQGVSSWQLTSSQADEVPDSTSADGSVVSFQQISESANLHVLDAASTSSRPITAEVLSDFSPSASADGQTIVFQRSQPIASQGYLFMDSTLMTGSPAGPGLMANTRAVANGFAPRLSPDGSRVAFLQRHPSNVKLLVLQVKDLRTGEVRTVSDRCVLPGLSMTPVEWSDQNFAWSHDSATLFYVEKAADGSGQIMRRHAIAPGLPDATLASSPIGTAMSDLFPSSDGKWLAYKAWSDTPHSGELRVIELASRAGRLIRPLTKAAPDVKGWTRSGTELVVLQRVADKVAVDGTEAIDILTVSTAGNPRRLGRIDHAFPATGRLDAARGVLFVTRAVDGIHNLYAMSLSTGKVQAATDNRLPGVTYSGVEPLQGGSTICVRDERRSDIWVIRASATGR